MSDRAAPLITDGWAIAGDAYRDPALFEVEMAEIFGRCWIYVAHESEIPDNGDYKTATIGRQPVIVARTADGGDVQVLFNRCRHRAATVCQNETGSANYFRCVYHGWTYANDGRLVGVPFPDAYGDEFDKAALGLLPVPRVQRHRGFVFASLDPEAPDLEQCLGHADRYLQYIEALDIELSAGRHRYAYDGNWKLQIENTIDYYHVSSTHRSWIEILKRRMGEGAAFLLDQAHTNPDWRTLDLGAGHAALEFGPLEAPTEGHADVGIGDLVPFNAVIFPTLGFVGAHLRVVQPIAVDRTEVHLYPMIPRGADDDRRAEILTAHQAFYGPAGAGSADDIEVGFDRVTRGLAATEVSDDRLLLSRGAHTEDVDPDTGIRVGRAMDELAQRAFYRRWLELVGTDA